MITSHSVEASGSNFGNTEVLARVRLILKEERIGAHHQQAGARICHPTPRRRVRLLVTPLNHHQRVSSFPLLYLTHKPIPSCLTLALTSYSSPPLSFHTPSNLLS